MNEQGFNIVGYGCTTCIGNSGDLDESVGSAITENGTSNYSFFFSTSNVIAIYLTLLSLSPSF